MDVEEVVVNKADHMLQGVDCVTLVVATYVEDEASRIGAISFQRSSRTERISPPKGRKTASRSRYSFPSQSERRSLPAVFAGGPTPASVQTVGKRSNK